MIFVEEMFNLINVFLFPPLKAHTQVDFLLFNLDGHFGWTGQAGQADGFWISSHFDDIRRRSTIFGPTKEKWRPQLNVCEQGDDSFIPKCKGRDNHSIIFLT